MSTDRMNMGRLERGAVPDAELVERIKTTVAQCKADYSSPYRTVNMCFSRSRFEIRSMRM
jgi:hypothetical protein